jgi:hypothetical protein
MITEVWWQQFYHIFQYADEASKKSRDWTDRGNLMVLVQYWIYGTSWIKLYYVNL